VDVRRPEGELEGPRPREVGRGDPEFVREFDADDLGAPTGMALLHGAGLSHDLFMGGAPAAVLVARLEVVAAAAKGPPDLPDRVVRQAEFAGDDAKLLAVESATDDFLTDRHG
jgi:hypothetical protein